jgi:hypothetical protein
MEAGIDNEAEWE